MYTRTEITRQWKSITSKARSASFGANLKETDTASIEIDATMMDDSIAIKFWEPYPLLNAPYRNDGKWMQIQREVKNAGLNLLEGAS